MQLYYKIRYFVEFQPNGLLALVGAIRRWWGNRPVLARCQACGDKFWANDPGVEFYCCEFCSHGQKRYWVDDWAVDDLPPIVKVVLEEDE